MRRLFCLQCSEVIPVGSECCPDHPYAMVESFVETSPDSMPAESEPLPQGEATWLGEVDTILQLISGEMNALEESFRRDVAQAEHRLHVIRLNRFRVAKLRAECAKRNAISVSTK